MSQKYYANPRSDVIKFLSKKVNKDISYKYTLDIGCASGEFGKNLKKKLVIKEFNWTGIEKEKNLPNSLNNYSLLGNIIHDDLPDCIDDLKDLRKGFDLYRHLI